MSSSSKTVLAMLFVAMILSVLSINVYAATILNSATGNWNATTTWAGGVVPTAADSVILGSGFTVTINVSNAACGALEVGSPSPGGSSGTVVFNSGSQLTVSRRVNLGNGAGSRTGSIDMTSGGTLICNSLTVNRLGTWTPGTGTIQFNSTFTLSTLLTTYNNLIINSGTTTVGVNTTLSGTLTVNTGAAFTIPAFNITVTGATSVTGTLNNTSTTGTKTFTGNVTINSGGTWNNSANEAISFAGNLQNGGTFTAGTGVNTFTGATKTFSGTISIPNLTMSGTYTNNGTLTVSTALAGAGTLTNGATGVLYITQATAPTPTITATAAGNTVNYNAAGAQTLKATTYSNLTLSGSGAKTVTGTTVNGTLSLQGTATTTGTIPTYGGSAIIEYAGSSAQATGIEMGTTVAPGVKINNASGVTLSASKTFNGTLTFTSGKLSTGANTLTAGTISGAGATSYIYGNLLKAFTTGGPTTKTYEIGDASTYAPVSVTINNVSVAGSLTAKTTGSEHPNIATSGLLSTKDVNRYWTLTNTGMTIDNYDAKLNWQASDVDGGATPANFAVSKFNSPNWALSSSSGQTGTSITANGLTSFSDFAVGELTAPVINASAGSNGTITPSGAVSVSNGDSQHFSIAPSIGYHVDSLIIDGTPITADTQYTFNNVVVDHTIRAAFTIDQFTITATAGANGTITPSGAVVVDYDNSQHFSIAPNIGYHIDSMIIDGTPITADTQYTFNNVQASHTIYAAFAIDQFTITATSGANGAILPAGAITANYGDNIHFSIAPDAGYFVANLVVDGTPVAADTQYTFNSVIANHTIDVTFALIGYTIEASAGTHGTITPAGSVFVQQDSNKTFIIAADAGYVLDSLLVDDAAQPLAGSYTFTAVTAAHTIRVVFKAEPFNLSIASGNWDDPATWSLGTVPMHTDSVVISTGKTVNLNVDGLCGAMYLAGKLSYSNDADRFLTVTTLGSLSGNVTITDTLEFAAQSNQKMLVGGDFNCTGAILSNSTGATGSYFVFNGTGAKSLSSDVPLRGFEVNDVALELTLAKALSVSNGIFLTSGKVVLGNYDLTLEPGAGIDTGTAVSYIVTDGTGKLMQTVGTATATFPVGALASFNRVTLATTTSSDVFGIRILSSVNPSSAKDSAAVQRTIDMSRAGTDDLGFLTMSFGWDASEQGALFVPASAASWRYDGSAWVEEGTFVLSGSGPYVGTILNIAATGSFAIGNGGALPIMLGEFKGMTVDAHTVKIEWTTVSEQNTYGFYVQRKGEKEAAYTDVSEFIGGAGTTLNEEHAYSWTDAKANDGVYYYRLRTVDLNGDVEYSSAIRVAIVLGVKDRIPVVFKLNQNYPNPFNPTTEITFDLPENGVVTLKIYNIIGQEVATILNGVQYEPGSYSQTFNASSFSSGVYYYRISVTGVNQNHDSLNKMVLIK
jgi:hypothetical protein